MIKGIGKEIKKYLNSISVTIYRNERERGDKLPASSDCRDPKFALSISILSTYLSHPSRPCICPSL